MKMNRVLLPSGAIGDDTQNIRQPFSMGSSQANRHVVWELLLSGQSCSRLWVRRTSVPLTSRGPVLSEPSAGSGGLPGAPDGTSLRVSELQVPGRRQM